MIGLYLASLLFGGILIFASLVLGGKDTGDHAADDGEVDHHHDFDQPHVDKSSLMEAMKGAGGERIWFLFLSMRFWTFFTASFGMTGLLLTVGVALPSVLIALISLLNGLFVGAVIAWMFKRLKTDQVTGDVGLGQVVGQEARVLVPIRPGDIGKIVVSTLAGRIELPARTGDAHTIDPGSTVLVAHIRDGVADVTALRGDGGTSGSKREAVSA